MSDWIDVSELKSGAMNDTPLPGDYDYGVSDVQAARIVDRILAKSPEQLAQEGVDLERAHGSSRPIVARRGTTTPRDPNGFAGLDRGGPHHE